MDGRAGFTLTGRDLACGAVYPLLVGGAAVGSWILLGAGLDSTLATGVVVVLAIVLIAALERVLPFDPAWNQARGDVATDGVHMIVNTLAVPGLFALGQAAVLASAQGLATSDASLGWWPDWPLPLQVAAALIVAEFGTYGLHWVEHRVEPFWRLHATHHSVERLYWLNTGRFHPVDAILSYAVAALPLAILGIPPAPLVVFSALVSVHGLVQHANVDARLGALNWLMSGPELHRWHHSGSLDEARCNYGGTLILWDVAFGTRRLPEGGGAPAVLGIEDMPNFPRGYLGQLLSPLRWPRWKAPAETKTDS